MFQYCLNLVNNIYLTLNTLKYLKGKQIFYRVLRNFVSPKVTESFNGVQPHRPKNWIPILLYNEKIDRNLVAYFLNHKKKLNFPTDWNNENHSKLWVYNLHYFEDFLSENSHKKNQFHRDFLNLWIDQNPIGSTNSWEPYPTSLRIVNILKAWLGGLELDAKAFCSIFDQASFLSNDLEKHILGNHYFVNLKALLFAGVIYDMPYWLEIAEQGLLSEIPEQILDDGANFELSPMYHSLMLVDMLDMFNLSRSYPGRISRPLVSALQKNIPKMIKFMTIMSHPDGGVSFFNDSVDGVSPTIFKIEAYAEKLGFATDSFDHDASLVFDNMDSGYICAMSNGSKLIFDASPVGPDYQPGHAHADTLSFEFSVGLERVFVNTGVSEYGLSSRRINQRKTCCHNTVEVDEKDSSKVWSGFRVAKRARILDRGVKLQSDKNIYMQATHNGYKSFFGGCLHTRQITFGNNKISVTDILTGSFKSAKSRFYFHPELSISLENNRLRVEGKKFMMTSNLLDNFVSIVDSVWHPEFGVTKSNKVIEIDFTSEQLELVFVWTSI